MYYQNKTHPQSGIKYRHIPRHYLDVGSITEVEIMEFVPAKESGFNSSTFLVKIKGVTKMLYPLRAVTFELLQCNKGERVLIHRRTKGNKHKGAIIDVKKLITLDSY